MTTSSLLTLIVLISSFLIISHCYKEAAESGDGGWFYGIARWYGPPNGAGAGVQGGSCGFGDVVTRSPYDSKVAAIDSFNYNAGQGCGQCYQVKCSNNSVCSGNPVTVTITDECKSCKYDFHFVLSGLAAGAMANPGMEDQLRNSGHLDVSYKRVTCTYPNTGIAFRVEAGSTGNNFTVFVLNQEGDGDLKSVDLKQNKGAWIPMLKTLGPKWSLNSTSPLVGPFSFRLTSLLHGETLTVKKVVPADWKSGEIYQATSNFEHK